MEITEVRVKLMENSDDRLQAFCSITFDDAFVVRDLKIIDGTNGPFVAMPSRKLTSHCSHCGCKNHMRAAYCNQCGARQREERTVRDHDGRAKLYADIAHPINSACREMIQSCVIAEFKNELERAKQPGYVSKYDDDYDLDFESLDHPQPTATAPTAPASVVPTPHFVPAPVVAETPAPAATEPAVDKSHMAQPAEQGPRGPHRLPTQQPATDRQETTSRRTGKDQFGAGIF